MPEMLAQSVTKFHSNLLHKEQDCLNSQGLLGHHWIYTLMANGQLLYYVWPVVKSFTGAGNPFFTLTNILEVRFSSRIQVTLNTATSTVKALVLCLPRAVSRGLCCDSRPHES